MQYDYLDNREREVYLERGTNVLDPRNFRHLRLGDAVGYYDEVTQKMWKGYVIKAYSDGELEISFNLVTRNPREFDAITVMFHMADLAKYRLNRKHMVAL